jgi:hypothetical protein
MQHRSFWERHPGLHAFLMAFLAGEWVTCAFAWFYMMVSRFAGPTMTIAVVYLMLYAIDSHHGLTTTVAHPSAWDSLATGASGIINVTPELVFPGKVVLAIRALLRRNWLHASLYALASLLFAVLTIMLLNAFMTDGITDSFLSGMLLWRAISALSYTVVAEVCSHHGEQSQDVGVQSQLEDLMHQVNSLQSELHSVHSELQRVQSTVQSQRVQSEVQHTSEPLTEPGQRTVNQVKQERVNPLPEQHAEHTYRPQGAVNPPLHGSVNGQGKVNPRKTEPLAPVHSPQAVNPQSEPVRGSVDGQGAVNQRSEPGKGSLVQQFIRAEMAQGRTPTLDDIMETCQCSRNTAIRYRRAILGETGQERHAPQLRIVQS